MGIYNKRLLILISDLKSYVLKLTGLIVTYIVLGHFV
jgi:hypothetical protein